MEEIRDRYDGEPADTGVGYGPGAAADAESLATSLGIDAARSPTTPWPGHIRVVLGEVPNPGATGTPPFRRSPGTAGMRPRRRRSQMPVVRFPAVNPLP